MLFVITLCQFMDLLQPKTGKSLAICFGYSLFLIILCLPVYENHKHVQGWNPTTTKYFPGINNNNIIEVGFQPSTCL